MVHIFHPLTKNSYYHIVIRMPAPLPKSWQETEDAEILATLACQAALVSDWDQAAKINQKILSRSKDNVEAINRLAKAYVCLGNIDKAKELYAKTLELDPYNVIATKNLEKIQKSNGMANHAPQPAITSGVNLSDLFLYEPGKTKIINLLNVAPPQVLASLNCGDKLQINPKNHSITLTTGYGVYLGALPDDLAHRLLAMLDGGNQYEAYVKSATIKTVTIFIREVQRSEKFINQPSFQNSNYTFTEDKESFE